MYKWRDIVLKKIEINLINIYAFLIPCVTATRFVGISAGRILVLLIVLIAMINALFNKKKEVNKYLLSMLFLYQLWMTCSLLWTPSSCINQGMIRTGTTMVICLFFLLILSRGVSEKELFAIKSKVMIGGVISALMLIIFGGDYYGDEEEVRYSLTPQTDPNFYSMYLLMPVALLYKIITTSKGKNKIISIVSMIVLIYAICLCGSRGALLSILIMSIVELIRNRKYGIVIVMLLGIYMAFDTIGEIYPRFNIENLSSGAGRSLIWLVVVEMIKDNILFGVGVSGIKGAYDDYAIQAGVGFLVGHGRDPHNAYMEILAELGIIGFLLYIGIVLYSIYKNNNNGVNNTEMVIGIIGTLVAAAFLTSILEEAIWFYLALMAAKKCK